MSNLRPFLIVSKTFDGFSSASSRLLFLILVDMIPPMMPPPTTIHIFPSSSRSLEKRGLGIGRRLTQWKKKVSLLEFPPHPWCVQFSIFLKRLGGLGFWLGTHIHVLVCHKWNLDVFFSMFFQKWFFSFHHITFSFDRLYLVVDVHLYVFIQHIGLGFRPCNEQYWMYNSVTLLYHAITIWRCASGS